MTIQNPKSKIQNRVALLALFSVVIVLCGCQISRLVGGMAQAEEYQKLIDTPAKYSGLENQTVAVVVQTDMATLYEHPNLVGTIASGVSARLGRDVPGIRLLNPQHVINWQYRTPMWDALPYGEMAEQLNVDRVVHIDLLEYRLNPAGNRWEWEGVAVGRVGVVERKGTDPDMFADTFDVQAKFPTITGVGRESATQRQIETGLQYSFVERTAWLFHQHLEPKYPDKYRPELETREQREARQRQASSK